MKTTVVIDKYSNRIVYSDIPPVVMFDYDSDKSYEVTISIGTEKMKVSMNNLIAAVDTLKAAWKL